MKRFLFFIIFLLAQISFFEASAQEAVLIDNGRRNICSGILYDDGGLAGNYQPGQLYEMMLCPDTPGGSIRLNFTTFLLAPGASLSISTGGAPIAGSPFTNRNSPGLVTSFSADGCITLVFSSDGGPTGPGFSATIMCEASPCQNIEALVTRTIPAFDPNTPPACEEDLGVIKVCAGSEVKLYGDAIFGDTDEGAIYEWSYKFNRQTVVRNGKNATYRFNVPGAYRMMFKVTDGSGMGCEGYKTFIIQVASSEADIVLSSDKPVYCLGEKIKLNAVANLISQEFIPEKVPSNPVALPDEPGVFFNSVIEIDYYCDSERIETVGDIIDLWMNIFHTYYGDLDIIVFAPNGSSVYLTKYFGFQAGFTTGHDFGIPNTATPFQYHFSQTAPFAFHNAPTVGGGFPAGWYLPWTFDSPGNSLANFIGSPINGTWRLRIEDKWGGDSGMLAGWDIEFSDRFQQLALSFTPVIANAYWMPHPDLVMENGQMVAKPLFPGQHTYTYVVIDDYGCTHTRDFTVTVQDGPVIGNVQNLQSCIDVNGIATFDLNDVTQQLNLNNADTIRYFNSQQDAENGVRAIDLTQTLNTLNEGFTKNVWVRVDRTGIICYAIDSFQLIAIRCNLDLNTLPNLSVCSDNIVNTASFDLTVQSPRVYNNNPDYEVLYFLTQEQAEQNQNSIPAAQLNSYQGSNGQTIWVRVQNRTVANEYSLTSFQLFINQAPTMPNITKIFGCPIGDDKGTGVFNLGLTSPVIIAGRPNLEIVYYKSVAGAISNNTAEIIHNLNNYQSINGTIGVRLVNLITGCYSVFPLDLEVVSLASIGTSLDLFTCSLSTAANGIGLFDLRQATIDLLGDQVSPYIEVKYYLTANDANQNINAIGTTTYVNTVPFNQTIYARVAYVRSNCYQVVPVNLTVNPKVVVPERIIFNLCVDNPNREMVVDLTTKEAEITAQLIGIPTSVVYYTSRIDAETQSNRISNPQNYTSALGRSVWVRVDNLNTGCYGLTNIVLTPVVMPTIPVIADYQICEDLSIGAGFARFDLLTHINSLIGTQPGLTVSFYLTNSNAQAGVNPLPGSYVNTNAYEQNIYVRFETSTGCVLIKQMMLKALSSPVLNIPTDPVAICSVNNDGFGVFNLLSLVTELQNGDPNIQISFYETEASAVADIDRIPNPNAYNNIVANDATVYVRGTLVGGCFVVKPLHLSVVSTPLNPIELNDLVVCSDDPLVNTGVVFDLTVQDLIILASQNDRNVRIQYYLSEANALDNVNAISNPARYANTRNNQVIWYRVTNKFSSCYTTGSFRLIVKQPLVINNPRAIEICQASLPNTGRGIFDLTLRRIEILGREIVDVTLQYYESEEDAKANRNAIVNPSQYTNNGNPQTIWVAVNSFNGCRSYTTITIRVIPLPNVNLNPRPIAMCDSSPNQTGIAVFDLESRELEIANQSNNYVFEYYNSKVGAETRDAFDRILFPDIHSSSSAIVWVRVTSGLNGNNNCPVVLPLELQVKPLPVFNPINFLICEDNTDGFHNFNLLDKKNDILNGKDPDDFDIYFYLDRGDAERNNIGVAILPNFTNTVAGRQQIFVRVNDKLTGCFYVGVINLLIEEKVYAFDINRADKERIEKCALPEGPSGRATFNLSDFSAEIVGLQNIPRADLVVTYYASEADYAANRPLTGAQANNLQLPIGKHTIVAVVKQRGDFLCSDEVRFELTVFETPIAPVLSGAGIACVDYKTGKLINSVIIDSGFDSGIYEFQWERMNGMLGFEPIVGATLSHYAVDNISSGNTFRVVVNFKGAPCKTTSTAVSIDFAPEIPIAIKNADSTGMIGDVSTDNEGRVTVEVISPTDTRFEYALNDGAYQDSRFFYDVPNGIHKVWVRYKNQYSICPQYIEIFVLGYPKFFTPNGDGFNDTWNIPQLKGHPEAEIFIYDRYGKLITQLKPSEQGWDGTFNGKPLPATDYWFSVEYLQEPEKANEMPRKIQHKGHFSLKR